MSEALKEAGPMLPHSLGAEYVHLRVPGHMAGRDGGVFARISELEEL